MSPEKFRDFEFEKQVPAQAFKWSQLTNVPWNVNDPQIGPQKIPEPDWNDLISREIEWTQEFDNGFECK